MFSLKVKNLSWEDNKVRYTFLAVSIVLIAWLKIPGIAAAIAWYIVLSVLLNYVTVTPPTYGNKDNYNK